MIKISGDSSLDLSKELYEKYNISTISITCRLGENEYQDGKDITATEILEFVDKTGNLPKTSAINQITYEEYFQELTKNGDEVIHFNISSELSSCHQNAMLASQNVKNVYVVDTKNLSTGSALLALLAHDLIQTNKYSAKQIAEIVQNKVDDVKASFVLDNLRLLHKGGRCSAVAAFGANLLKLRPCIEVVNGKMGVRKKYRGKMEVVVKEYIEDITSAYPNIDKTRCFITYTTAPDAMLNAAVNTAKSLNLFDEILITNASGTVTSHCGHNTLGILFMTK